MISDSVISDFNQRWYSSRLSQFVDRERNTFELFLEEIEFGDCFPENEGLAIKIIAILKQKFNLLFTDYV